MSIPKAMDLYTITLPEALDLIQKAAEKTAANTRELGRRVVSEALYAF